MAKAELKIILLLYLILIIVPFDASARWLSVDPNARKYPSASPYAYGLANPIKLVDLDGKDVAFNVYQTDRTKQFGHMDMYFQDSKGNWLKHNQGDYGVKITSSEGPSEGSLLLKTTSKQDALITQSALKSKAEHESGKLQYNALSNNCKDAAVAVVNNSGAGVKIDNPITTITPSSWFNDQKNATVQLNNQQPGGQAADASDVVIVLPKYEVVRKEVQPPPPTEPQ